MTRLVALYPKSWRVRYEDEFLSLIEDRPPDALDRIDIVRGAIDARLHPGRNLTPEPEQEDPLPYNGPWSMRRAGALTLAGGFSWVATMAIAINGRIVTDGSQTYRDASAAMPTFFLSLMLLLVGVWAVAATLPSTSRIARSAALVAGLAGLLWALAPWVLAAGLLLCLGLTILAIEAARTRRWRRSDAAFLMAGMGAAVALAGVAVIGQPVPIGEDDVQFAVLVMLATLWFAIADALLRPARAIATRNGASPPA
jgi:hypothetical protein